MEVHQINLSDRTVTLGIEEKPDSVVVHLDKTGATDDFATLEDMLAFCNFWAETFEKFELDGRDLITMDRGQVVCLADKDGNLSVPGDIRKH